MKSAFFKYSLVGVAALWGALTLNAVSREALVTHPRLLSFEGERVPAFISASNSAVSLTQDHYKDGGRSLLWKYGRRGVLTIDREIPFEPQDSTGADTYLSGFVVWVHNAKPVADSLTFQFLKDDRVCSHFKMGLDFKGWRAAYVCFERDMQGTPEQGMNQLKIIAPNTPGQVAIDHLLAAAKMDHRHQTADCQVPFVNPGNTNHWLQLLNHSRRSPDLASQPLTALQREGIAMMEQRFLDMIYRPGTYNLAKLRKEYAAYDIHYNQAGEVAGLPIFFERNVECYERILPGYKKTMFTTAGMELKKYFNLMLKIASAHRDATAQSDRNELEEMFMAMYDHITDQGIAAGSCMGNFTHYGYSFRGYYPALYLMRETLRRHNRLDEAIKAMVWYGMTNEVFVKPTVRGMDIDSFNTMTMGRIASILMMDDSPLKVQYLKAFSRWIDNGCLPSDGLAGCFKTDGACFHHCNNYPAYAIGGLDGATNMLFLLSRTPFAVSPMAHETVKNVLLTMRFYCNRQDFPLAMSGRHPDGKGHLIPLQYARMALAGTPDGLREHDPEMAAAFLRLVEQPAGKSGGDAPEYVPTASGSVIDEKVAQLKQAGFKAEESPQGNLTLGYGCVNIHRRGNWSAVARGHSRYLWAAEHYRGENLYGRYLAHGSLQVITTSEGWVEAGFDWGRIPGATAIYLPIDSLKATVLNVDKYSGYEEMLLSDETFAGGISQCGSNGAFGIKLHEHDKYNGSLRARKSYHFLNDVIVCLGSDIENQNKDFDTETTILQLNLPDSLSRNYWTAPAKGDNWCLDHLATGYYLPGGMAGTQLSVDLGRASISNEGVPTVGDWASLTINHGRAPRGESYHYAILPATTPQAMRAFAAAPSYTILRHDREGHIVRDDKGEIYSYVLFEKTGKLPSEGLLHEVDAECMVMVQEKEHRVLLTVANPDLALYDGPADEVFDQQGRRVERSIYSRPWKDNPSQERPVRVTLRGGWAPAGAEDGCRVISQSPRETILEFSCREGASIDVALEKMR